MTTTATLSMTIRYSDLELSYCTRSLIKTLATSPQPFWVIEYASGGSRRYRLADSNLGLVEGKATYFTEPSGYTESTRLLGQRLVSLTEVPASFLSSKPEYLSDGTRWA